MQKCYFSLTKMCSLNFPEHHIKVIWGKNNRIELDLENSLVTSMN